MKTLFLAIALILSASLVIPTIHDVRAIPNMSPQDLYKQSDMVFYGQVISKQSGPGPDYYYQVKVQTYFKNPQTSDSITVAGYKYSEGHVTYPEFQVGDKAIFYVENIQGINTISPYSTKAGEGCNIHAFLGPAPIAGEPIVRGPPSPLDGVTDVNITTRGPFMVNQDVLVSYHVWNNFPQPRNIAVELSATNQNDTTISYYKKQNVQVDPCDAGTVNWVFAPTKSGNYIVNATENEKFRAGESFEVVDSGLHSYLNSKYVDSPLKQFKSRISAKDVACKEDLDLVIKAEDGTPACVRPDTAQILIERGWAKETVINTSIKMTHDTYQQIGQTRQASVRKIVDLTQLNRTLAGRPIDNFTGIIFNSFDWSHDGKFLVFSTSAGNPPSYLWVMSSDGKQTRIIPTPKIDSIYSPRISPDDSSVYYLGGYSNNGTWYQDVYRCILDESDSCQDLTPNSKIGAFDLMPSGKGLVFVENHSDTTFVRSFTYLVRHYNLLWLSDMEGKKQRLLFNGTQSFSGLSVGPDGNTIVFFDRGNPVHPKDNGTYTEYNLPGGGIPGPEPVYLALFDISRKNFTVLDNSTDYVYGNFGWTKDGNYIVADKLLSSVMVEVKSGAYSSAGLVTLIPVLDPENQTVLYGLQTMPYMPTPEGLAVSPDQKSIVFGIDTEYNGNTIQGRGIYRMDFVNPLS